MSATDTNPTAGVNAPDGIVRIGLYVVVLGAIVVSGETLVRLAQYAGWTGLTGFLLPVLIDLPGFLGARIWLRRKPTNPQTRQYARRLTFATLGASVLGNIVGHLIHAGYLPTGIGLVIVVATVAPIVLAAVLHLDALLAPNRDQAPAEREPVAIDEPAPADLEQPAAIAEPAEPPAIEPAQPVVDQAELADVDEEPAADRHPVAVPAPAATAEEIMRAAWDAAIAEGRLPSGSELARAADVNPTYGRKFRRKWETEPAALALTGEDEAAARRAA